MYQNFTKSNLNVFGCFRVLSESELTSIWELGSLRKIDKFEKIYASGEECCKIYFLLKGCIKSYLIDNEGKEHISAIVHATNIFGECCLFGQNRKAFSAETIDDDNYIFEIDDRVLKTYMKSNFDFNLAVLEMVGEKIAKKEDRLITFATKDARSRILDFLKENAITNGRQVGSEMLIRHNLTQQDIATFTGTSRQTVTTVLNDLKSKNQIYLKRKTILIRDVATLS